MSLPAAPLPRLLYLTDRSPRHQDAAQAAAPPGLEIVMLRRPTAQVLAREIAEADFLITERAGEIDAELIAAAPKLRLIQRLGSLYYDIDLGAAQRAGVMVCIRPILGCILVAEHLLLQMLALVKRLPEASAVAQAAADWGPARRTDENVFAYNWSGRTQIGGLYGKTIGILGFGEIGAELARRLQAFVPRGVLYHKRHPLPGHVEADLGITYATRAEIVAACDLLCVLLPYTPATDLALNGATFAAMPPGACLVSCGSGSVIDETALAAALQSGHLGGAALDTFEWEPLRPTNPLVHLARDPAANLLLTPHTAAGTVGDGGAGDWENVRRVLAGEEPFFRVV
jgi:phosphoglycerate dehydrogenase-like enzyme